jgi:hypothetical protein
MTEKQAEHRVSFLQYFNSVMITLACGFSVMTATMVSGLRADQKATDLRVTEIATKQISESKEADDTNLDLANLHTYVYNTFDNYRTWVENNFVRKK